MPTKNITKDVKYLGKDFVGLRNSLIELAKVYYPDSYNDFNESSPGMMFIEMTSAIGDLLSYYIDSNLKESMMYYANDRKNVINLSSDMGYVYKVTSPSTTKIDVMQLIPAKTTISGSVIDDRYALKINAGMVVSSATNPNLFFRTINPIDFSITNSEDPAPLVYDTKNGTPVTFLITKQVDVISGQTKQIEFSVEEPKSFLKLSLPETNVIEILSVTDSDGNDWYEVDYLAQDTIFVDEENIYFNETSKDRNSAPYILKIKPVAKRFVKRVNESGITELQFGSGKSSYADDVIIPNPNLPKNNKNFIDVNNFSNTKSYGQAPSNTTLTVTYTVGGGIESNCNQGDLTQIQSVSIKNSPYDFSVDERPLFNTIKNSLRVINQEPAVGGRGSETTEEIRQNAIAFFHAQDRCITLPDYMVRAVSMPQKYGSVARCYAKKNEKNFTIDLFCLGFNANNNFTQLNDTVKQNLKTYLSYYCDLNTVVVIKDAYVVNIGVEFDIITLPKYNKNQVILACIEEIKKYFDPNKWQINQPIILSELYTILDAVDGVRTVSNINIVNKYGSADGYTDNFYDISKATLDEIVYPSVDPMIFELTYPNKDIKGSSK